MELIKRDAGIRKMTLLSLYPLKIAKSPYISSIERYAKEEGLLEGKAEGKAEGAAQTRLEVAERLVAGGMSKVEAAMLAGVSVDLL